MSWHRVTWEQEIFLAEEWKEIQRFYRKGPALSFHDFLLHPSLVTFGNRRCQRVEDPKSLNSVPTQCSRLLDVPKTGR